MANVVFCDNCGAANPAGVAACSQCRAPLYTAGPVPRAGRSPAPEDDGFRILATSDPPTTPLPVAPARARAPQRATPGSLDDIPIAPRRAVRADQQPPLVPLPGGLPEGIPPIELPKAPKIEPPKVAPPKGLLGFLQPTPPPAPTGRKESTGAPPEVKIPKWMIALVAVLGLFLIAIAGAAAIKTGPFDNAPVTAAAATQQATIAAVQTQAAEVFITQTHTVELAQATAWAQATADTAAASTITALAGATASAAAVTAVAVEHAATAAAVQTVLSSKDAAATVAVSQAQATQTALTNALGASQTQVGAAQTAIGNAQATAHALELQKSIQATMNTLLTQVAPPARPESDQPGAAPGQAARPSTAPGPVARSDAGQGGPR